MSTDTELRRKPRTLALELVESLGDRIRDGRLALGAKLPTEAAIMAEFNVSRTVVREAISKLQASGLVETRHGIGTFVLGLGQAPGFKISADQVSTLLPKILTIAVVGVALWTFIKTKSFIKSIVTAFMGGVLLWLTGNLAWVRDTTGDELQSMSSTSTAVQDTPPGQVLNE